jgi:cytochrome c-type biogenesis protein CcmF
VLKRIALPALLSARRSLLRGDLLLAPGIGILPLLGLVLAPASARASLAPLWGATCAGRRSSPGAW